MGGAPTEHALQRSISKLAIGVARDVSRRADRDAPNKLAERCEEFQIKASGVAADLPAWSTAEIAFDIGYTQATGSRNSELIRPQISVGWEQSQGVGLGPARLVPVFASLAVIDWSITHDELIDGCTFACAAIAPGDQVTFKGFFHLTIQGFGSSLEDRDGRD